MSYSAIFNDHLTNPRNVGEIPNATAIAEETNPICGDRLRLSLVVKDEKVESARYLAYGCAPTLVAGSVLTELLIGKNVNEAVSITRAELIESIGGLPSRKHHAAALAIEAVRVALTTVR